MYLYYSQNRNQHDFIGQTNSPPYNAMTVGAALWSLPEVFDMFLRRWTTVQERFLQPPGTHPLLLHYERRVNELAGQIGPDSVLDTAVWGPLNPPTFFPYQTLTQAVSLIKTQYFIPRRPWIFNTLRYANGGPYL